MLCSDRIFIKRNCGPNDEQYSGKFGSFIKLEKTGNGFYARIYIDGMDMNETVLVHPESIEHSLPCGCFAGENPFGCASLEEQTKKTLNKGELK